LEFAVTLTRIEVAEEVTDGYPKEMQSEPAACAGIGAVIELVKITQITTNNRFIFLFYAL
jgi:hypothetical protein